MPALTQPINIPTIINDGKGVSTFSTRPVELNGDEQRMLSEQISAVNFRLRKSGSEYASGWHVAGDPTLLIMLAGIMRIYLRNGECRDFSAGDMYVAEDYLLPDVDFDNNQHGHRAEVIGDDDISVLHLKLEKRATTAIPANR